MKRIHLCTALLFFATVVSGCRTSKPPLSKWSACLIRDHELRPKDSAKAPTLHPADRQGRAVLYLHAEWGKSLFVTEYTAGYLMVNLPWPLEKKQVVVNGENQGMYREGGQALLYNSLQISGKIRVIKKSSRNVELRLDLVARAPSIDRKDRSEISLTAKIDASVVASPEACH